MKRAKARVIHFDSLTLEATDVVAFVVVLVVVDLVAVVEDVVDLSLVK